MRLKHINAAVWVQHRRTSSGDENHEIMVLPLAGMHCADDWKDEDGEGGDYEDEEHEEEEEAEYELTEEEQGEIERRETLAQEEVNSMDSEVIQGEVRSLELESVPGTQGCGAGLAKACGVAGGSSRCRKGMTMPLPDSGACDGCSKLVPPITPPPSLRHVLSCCLSACVRPRLLPYLTWRECFVRSLLSAAC